MGLVKLHAYLERIGYTGPLEPTFQTLRAIHRAHLFAIPYENLDIHLGHALTLDPQAIYKKIVMDGRGGWCFEMNGLLAWALQEIGFSVTYLSGSVNRADLDGPEYGDHLVLLVRVEGQPFVADVGFGDGFFEPVPLREGEFVQQGLAFRLKLHPDGHWVMHNHRFGGAKQFDFSLKPRQMSYFAGKCYWLQTSKESGFVKTTVCQRAIASGFVTLRGAVLTRLTAEGPIRRTLESALEFDAVLREHFGLALAESAALWDRVWARHLEWVASNPTS